MKDEIKAFPPSNFYLLLLVSFAADGRGLTAVRVLDKKP